jgi:hypothetical protein
MPRVSLSAFVDGHEHSLFRGIVCGLWLSTWKDDKEGCYFPEHDSTDAARAFEQTH